MAYLGVEETKNSIWSRRQKIERLRAELKNERSSFESQWLDNSDYILPLRARFFTTNTNKGDRRNHKIIDSTATMAARTLRSGMMAGVTSPARPWFKLGVPGYKDTEQGASHQWLHYVTREMSNVFLKSNLYNVLPVIYGDLGVFGTAAMLVEEDSEKIISFSPLPIGSYYLSNDKDLKVNTFLREFRLTVRQVIEKFALQDDGFTIDWSVVSSKIKNLWDNNTREAWVDIVHVIMPNDMYNPNKLDSKYKKYISIYYEQGTIGYNNQGSAPGDLDSHKFLSEKGSDFFRVLAPRWEVSGEDVYGTDCPGMICIGDVKQLQTGEKRALQAVEKMVNPAMVGPTALKKAKASILPGDITYVDDRDGRNGFRPAHEINFDINALEMKQQQVRQRIQRAFYEDLFLMLAQSDRRQITAREIEERHQEKLLALGPVLEQLNQDLLDPLIDITFYLMERKGLIPDAPEEIQDKDLKVEYISIMAQAQKLAGLGSIERFAGFASQVASVDPGVLDKINTDQIVDYYGDLTSVPPGVLRSDEEVAKLRADRAESQRRQQMAEQAQMEASTAKTLSDANVGGDNLLSQITGGLNAIEGVG